MPRDNDTGAEFHTNTKLHFSANLDCPKCGTIIDGVWEDSSVDIEQMVDPPVAEQICPECGHKWMETYPGWTNYSDAG